MRPSDNAPVCSKIMTTIKMVASISLLLRMKSNLRKPCATTGLEGDTKHSNRFLNPSGAQGGKSRQKRRDFRLNGRLGERCVRTD
jgi:hypothetical protein